MSKLYRLIAPLVVAGAACSSSTKPPAGPAEVAAKEANKTMKEAALKPSEQYAKQCQDDMASARALIARIDAAKSPTVDGALVPYNDALILLQGAQMRSELFAEVHPDADYRAAAEDCTKAVSKLQTDILLDRDLFEAVKGVKTDGLPADTKRFVEHAVRDFRRAGVDKDPETRHKLKEIEQQVVATGLLMDKNIREDVRKLRFAPADLLGLPQDYLDAHKPGPDGKIEINTDYPDYLPFRSYVKNAAARKAMYLEYMNRGWPQNDEVLRRLFTLRQEKATLLGYKSWADYITEDKMIKSAANAQDFIDKITKASDERARADYKALLKREQKDDPKAKSVQDYDRAYYEELVKKETLGFDSQSVRPYFEFNQTRDGLLAVTSKLFGVEYKPATDAKLWHQDVDAYDVFQAGTGEKLGRIYLDLHPRENKYKHAAQFSLQPGVAGKQLPEGVLVCNFTNPRTSQGPALMDHDDVKTMFHEFGHLMHHVLAGKQRWVMFSGVANEWDFVEAPSQMLEEWASDAETLALFAKNVTTKEPIPAKLVHDLRAADEFGKGVFARRQMYLAELSLRAHMDPNPSKMEVAKLAADIQDKYSMLRHVPDSHEYAAFGHLNGYSAMYYTYMWSQVIAKDLFSEFQKHGLMDEATARKYREKVLMPGGSKDSADLVKDFLGRPYSFESYRKWLNQT